MGNNIFPFMRNSLKCLNGFLILLLCSLPSSQSVHSMKASYYIIREPVAQRSYIQIQIEKKHTCVLVITVCPEITFSWNVARLYFLSFVIYCLIINFEHLRHTICLMYMQSAVTCETRAVSCLSGSYSVCPSLSIHRYVRHFPSVKIETMNIGTIISSDHLA